MITIMEFYMKKINIKLNQIESLKIALILQYAITSLNSFDLRIICGIWEKTRQSRDNWVFE